MAEAHVIRVMAVDDHPLMMAGISGEINAQPDMRVVAEAFEWRPGVSTLPQIPSRYHLDGCPNAEGKRHRRHLSYPRGIPTGTNYRTDDGWRRCASCPRVQGWGCQLSSQEFTSYRAG